MSRFRRAAFVAAPVAWAITVAGTVFAQAESTPLTQRTQAQSSTAQQSEAGQNPQRPRFGGPDQVDTNLAEDDAPKRPLLNFDFLQPYLGFKQQLQQDYGFGFSFDYSATYLAASSGSGETQGASGMVRAFGAWDLVGRESGNTGALVYKIENRHGFSAVPPSGLGFETGYVGIIAPPFSDQQTRLTNLYWRQRIAGGRVAIVAGFLDATDYVDVYALASPWLGFTNLVFSTGSATIALPNDALLGFAVGAMITDNFYVIGGLGDSNADPTDPFDGFDTFFNVREYFKHIEVGWTRGQDLIYLDNMHVTVWHNDERVEALVPEGWGANVSASFYLNEQWLPFFRAGYAEDGGSLLQKSVSTGVGYQRVQGQDLLGVGFNWGQPNATTFGPGLDDQISIEVFYRLQLAERLAITPDLQYIANPALDPQIGSNWFFGLRARLAL